MDNEYDGQPTGAADGDDTDGQDDDDGIVFVTPLIPGQSAVLQATASASGILEGWFDWNGNGSWADAADYSIVLVTLAAGANTLTFSVPATAVPGSTYVRFRFSSQGVNTYLGQFWNGEVEDYKIRIESTLDYGDAPDPSYPTLLSSNGARHQVDPTIFLGTLVDTEPDGQPNTSATGDDLLQTPDEDGVVFGAPLVPGASVPLTVTASAAGFLNAWIDFNADGDWNDPSDRIFTDQPLSAGANQLTVTVPTGAALDTTYARFRFDTSGGLTCIGWAADGEVEDYRVRVVCATPCPSGGTSENEDCGEDVNGGCNMENPAFTPIACGDTICALTWADTSWRDTDWFQLETTEALRVRMTLHSEIPLYFGLVESLSPGVADCDSITGNVEPYAAAAPCSETVLEMDLPQAGTYWIWTGPQSFSGYPCTEGPHNYWFYVECLGLYPEVEIHTDGQQVQLDWYAVTGADCYGVYSSSSAWASFPGQWTLETPLPPGVADTTWQKSISTCREFYRVTAVMNGAATVVSAPGVSVEAHSRQ